MEGLSRGYSLRLTTFDMQLKSPLANDGVIISRVFVVRQGNSRRKFAGSYEHLLRIVSSQGCPENFRRFDTRYFYLSIGMDGDAQQNHGKYDRGQ